MKKLLEIGVDFVLFLFLLIILAVPVLVSFNLDPQLYFSEKPEVAGAKTVVGENVVDFQVEEKLLTTPGILHLSSIREGNEYEASLRILPQNVKEQSYLLGNINNINSEPVKLIARLYGDKLALNGSTIYIIADSRKYIAFEDGEFNENLINLPGEASAMLKVVIDTPFPLQFQSDVRLVIYGVTEV